VRTCAAKTNQITKIYNVGTSPPSFLPRVQTTATHAFHAQTKGGIKGKDAHENEKLVSPMLNVVPTREPVYLQSAHVSRWSR
jgi:hypothetical protein